MSVKEARAIKKAEVDSKVGMEMVALSWESMSRPNRGTGHWGITKKEWTKVIELHLSQQRRGRVLWGRICWPPTPTIGEELGMVGPRNSFKSEKVAPVSNKKEVG